MDLCHQKEYKLETMYLAINIFDRFLSQTYMDLSIKQLPALITSCVILGAKCEQPMTPSINRMIKLLNEDERQVVTKAIVIEMESRIVVALNFDFSYLSPITFVERFIRLSEFQNN